MEIQNSKFKIISSLPKVNLSHLKYLTDNTGVVQHCIYNFKDYRFGYSCDDVARALVIVFLHYDLFKDKEDLDLAKIYLQFIYNAQTGDGCFHNFMNYEKIFIDKEGSEDTFGRCLWGLGTAINYELQITNYKLKKLAEKIFVKALPNIKKIKHPRALAYSIIGLYNFLQINKNNKNCLNLIDILAHKLINLYKKNLSLNWYWVNDALTYGNAKIPQSLLLAFKITAKNKFFTTAITILDFLTQAQYKDGYFNIIGNDGWYFKGKTKAIFDQQPIDAGYLAECYLTAYEITKEKKYLKLANDVFQWFLGKNILKKPLYNFKTGACYDGLEKTGVNENCGAESTICFLIAQLNLIKVLRI